MYICICTIYIDSTLGDVHGTQADDVRKAPSETKWGISISLEHVLHPFGDFACHFCTTKSHVRLWLGALLLCCVLKQGHKTFQRSCIYATRHKVVINTTAGGTGMQFVPVWEFLSRCLGNLLCRNWHGLAGPAHVLNQLHIMCFALRMSKRTIFKPCSDDLLSPKPPSSIIWICIHTLSGHGIFVSIIHCTSQAYTRKQITSATAPQRR